jgi:hypothetical protein
MKELDIDNTSFYSIPKIGTTGTERASEGPVKGIPGRVQKTSDMTAISNNVPAMPRSKDAPDNDPRSWNIGGDGTWWSSILSTSQPSGDTEGTV